jgi:hypothetical protein
MTSRIHLVALAASLSGFAGPAPALAQASPAVEVFAGYSLLPANSDDFPRKTSHGLQVSVAANLNRWFGVFGDLGAQFDSATYPDPVYAGLVAKSTVREFFLGPRFTARSAKIDVFAHGLFGVVQGDAGDDFSGFSDTGLALGGGGGVDMRVHRRLAVRAQFDLFGSFADIVEVNSRFGLGLVARLGGDDLVTYLRLKGLVPPSSDL